MLPGLAARARRVVLTRPASPRAADPATLTALVPAAKSVRVEARIDAALELALADEPGRPEPPTRPTCTLWWSRAGRSS